MIHIPTQQPHGNRILLRETTWLQVTALGCVFSNLDTASNSYTRLLRRRLLPERLTAARATVSTEPDMLLQHYIENLVFLLQRVVEHVSLATPTVIHAQFVQEHSPYVRADLHLERLSPAAAATITQYFLTVQAELKQAAAQELIADRSGHDPLLPHQE